MTCDGGVSAAEENISLRFGRPRQIVAFCGAALFFGVCVYMAVDSLLWFVDRYEPSDFGNRGRLLRELNFESDGWFGAILFGVVGLLTALLGFVFLRNIFTDLPVAEIDAHSLYMFRAFRKSRERIHFTRISSTEIAVRGRGMNSFSRSVGAHSPMGARWVINRMNRKESLIIDYSYMNGKSHVLLIHPETVEDGMSALTEFHEKLESRRQALRSQ